MSPESGPGDTLGPTESLDSDEVRNTDGDVPVSPPDHWQAADRDEMTTRGQHLGESHAERLAQEEPDVPEAGVEPSTESAHIDATNAAADDDRPTRRHRGQIDDTPEDGGGFFEETP